MRYQPWTWWFALTYFAVIVFFVSTAFLVMGADRRKVLGITLVVSAVYCAIVFIIYGTSIRPV